MTPTQTGWCGLWFESLASTKAGGTQAFLSACLVVGTEGRGMGEASNIKMWNRTHHYNM